MQERLKVLMGERTLVLLKPDALKRGLVGPILERFERSGLKIVACKLVQATKKQLDGHFHGSDDWVRGMGEKSLDTYREFGLNPLELLGTDDPFEMGLRIRGWNYHYLTLGPVMVLVLQGIHAVDVTRKLIGNTLPYKANPGTIRGDFSINAPDLANLVGSSCKNLIHASGDTSEAEVEIKNWFTADELVDWDSPDDFIHFIQGEFTEAPKEAHMTQTTIVSLEQKLASLRESDPRSAGEHAYALASLNLKAGKKDEAQRFGQEAIKLLDSTANETLQDCAARNTVLGGIVIPDIFHSEVVRDRLQPLSL